MAGTPVAERPPKGLDAEHLGIWRHAVKVLKDQDSWSWELAPLLAEYVYALMAARDARVGFEWLHRLEDVADSEIEWQILGRIAGGLPTAWDRHTKRAAALADQLALTPRGRKAVGVGEQEETSKPADPFAALDQVSEQRRRRASKGAGGKDSA